jgi:hypothetical protein
MAEFVKFLALYEVLIYIVLAIGGCFLFAGCGVHGASGRSQYSVWNANFHPAVWGALP